MRNKTKRGRTARIMLSQRAVQVWLSKWMVACMIATILFGNAGLAFAEEISRDAVEAGSDVTISFGEEEENKIRIHVNHCESLLMYVMAVLKSRDVANPKSIITRSRHTRLTRK